jgi:hypothetical protein
MALDQETLFSEQILGYGPSGVTFDFPLYYDVRPTGLGTLHVRHGARLGASAYSNRGGWSFDMVQNYNGRGAGSDGTIEITGLTRSDWGARWTHAQRLGGATQGQLYVDMPSRSGLFGNAVVSRQFRGFRVGVNLSGARSTGYVALSGLPTNPLAPGSETPDPSLLTPQQQEQLAAAAEQQQQNQSRERATIGNLRGQISAETDARSLPGMGPVRYSLSLSSARQAYFGKTSLAPYDVHTVGVRLSTPPVVLLNGRTRVTPLLSVGQAWTSALAGPRDESAALPGNLGGVERRAGLSLLGTVSLQHSFGGAGSASLVYDYSDTPQQRYALSNFSSSSGRQRLGASLFLNGGERWNLSLFGSQTLGSPFRSLYGTAGLSLGGPWRAQMVLSTMQGRGYQFSDAEFALVRRIAGRDVAVYYSTTSRRFQLDLSGARF